jgi:hypothetical protein
MEKNYTQCFSTFAGAQVLKHLRSITIERYLGANATDAELRSLEAQRALVHIIENMIEKGKL